jgi:hypothetical protein
MDEIYTCLEQKKILITEILNITKRIELRTRGTEIELDNLLELRGSFISRVAKCDDFILTLSQSLSDEQQQRLQRILHSELTEEDCSDTELRLLRISKECVSLLQSAGQIDQSARNAIQAQCNELREKINEARKSSNQKEMYNNIN